MNTTETSSVRTLLMKGIVASSSTIIIVPFFLGVVVGDLDATVATYKLLIMTLWSLDIWLVPLAYGGYKLVQYIRR